MASEHPSSFIGKNTHGGRKLPYINSGGSNPRILCVLVPSTNLRDKNWKDILLTIIFIISNSNSNLTIFIIIIN